MTLLSKRMCPVCLSKETNHLYKQDFNSCDLSLMKGYEVVSCSSCGMCYADSVPSQAEFNEYYSQMSKYESSSEKSIHSQGVVEHFEKIFQVASRYLKSTDARILDIGCSTGGLLSVFKKNNYHHLFGIDPSAACVAAARDWHGIIGSADTIHSFHSKDTYDLVVMTAVLEHLVDFDESLMKIRSLIVANGLFVVEVPDASRFTDFVSAPFQQFSVEHINYFTEQSLINLVSRFGFELVAATSGEVAINSSVEPDLLFVFRKTDIKAHIYKKDIIGHLKIQEYITRSLKVEMDVKHKIQLALNEYDKVIVWGTGTHTLRLLGTVLSLSKIDCFVDSNLRYVGRDLHGIKIIGPGSINNELPIIISSYGYQDEIEKIIVEKLKLKNKIVKLY